MATFEFSGLHQVALGVSDLERSMAFYGETLGAEAIASFDPPGLAFFRLGTVRLLVERTEAPSPGSGVLYLEVAEIEDAQRSLTQRGVTTFRSMPRLIHRDDAGVFGERGTEEWMTFFEDPDGNVLALVARVAGP